MMIKHVRVCDCAETDTVQTKRYQNVFEVWVRLFKTNDVVYILNLPIFFIEKNVRSFCSAKASLILSTKNFSVFAYKGVKQLRVDLLTSSLS